MHSFFRITSMLCSKRSPVNIQHLNRFPLFPKFSSRGSGFNIRELRELMLRNDQIPAKFMTNLLRRIDFRDITVEEGSLLLQCCGEFTVDTTAKERDKICKKIFEGLLGSDKFNKETYLMYIKVCTDNKVNIHTQEFLNSIKCEPDPKLYKYLIENVCRNGTIEDAYSLLKLMKNKGFSADEDVFNNLTLVHAAQLGLESAETVLLTMKTAHIEISNNTRASILQGILKRGNFEDLKKYLPKYKFELAEKQLLTILKELGLSENISLLPEIKLLYNTSTLSREFSNQLRNICIHLVHMGKSSNAMTIVESFMTSTKNFGFFILEEMLISNMGIDEIIQLAHRIHTNGCNEFVFENLTGIALKNQNIDSAWKLLENFETLKPHYFWPLLSMSYQQSGELGLMEVIKKMIHMNAKPDYETLEYYVLPFCNLNEPQLLVDKISKLGLTVKELLCPALIVLLRNGKTKVAAELCNSYKVSISGQNLLELISSSWYSSRDEKSLCTILQRFCESSKTENDFVGDFLIMCLEQCTNTKDFESFDNLLKAVNENKLKMTTSSADVLHNNIERKCDENILQQIKRDLIVLLDFRLKPEDQYIPHPRNMTLEELECHLIELEEKNMETRGVLRKLIQNHANSGNNKRVQHLRDRFLSAGYTETSGMKCTVMHSFVKGGHLQPALDIYDGVKEKDPTFLIDVFKVLDLATLLVKSGRFSQGLQILQDNSKTKIFGGPSVQRNCCELLRACENEQEQIVMFEFLVAKGFCKATNVILGPLVRIHLKNGNLEKAVSVYVDLVEKYKSTPLQLELMKEIVRTNNENLLQTVLNSTIRVHGMTSTQSVLIIALAEEGMEKILRKILNTNKLPVENDLKRRCERLAKEGKVEALMTLANCCKRLPNQVIDIRLLYEFIMRIYSGNNDCQSALKLYNFLLDEEIPTSRSLEEQLCNLLKHNNYDLPRELKVNKKQL